MGIKDKLLKLKRTQTALLLEVRKRGYPGLQQSQLSGYIHNTVLGPQKEAVISLVYKILDEWEAENNG